MVGIFGWHRKVILLWKWNSPIFFNFFFLTQCKGGGLLFCSVFLPAVLKVLFLGLDSIMQSLKSYRLTLNQRLQHERCIFKSFFSFETFIITNNNAIFC